MFAKKNFSVSILIAVCLAHIAYLAFFSSSASLISSCLPGSNSLVYVASPSSRTRKILKHLKAAKTNALFLVDCNKFNSFPDFNKIIREASSDHVIGLYFEKKNLLNKDISSAIKTVEEIISNKPRYAAFKFQTAQHFQFAKENKLTVIDLSNMKDTKHSPGKLKFSDSLVIFSDTPSTKVATDHFLSLKKEFSSIFQCTGISNYQ